MRKSLALLFVTAAGITPGPACSNSNQSGPTTEQDAEAESSDDAANDVRNIPPPDTGPTMPCKLGDGSDPVALCTQKIVFTTIMDDGVYGKGQGMPGSWDSSTGVPNNDHTWQADLGLASAIASFNCSEEIYGACACPSGNNGIRGELAMALPDIATLLEAELPKAPAGYDGEVYFRLRNAAAGLYAINENAHAQKLHQLADDYGRAIKANYAQAVTPVDGGVPAVVLGTTVGAGKVAYAPAQAIMGAAALLDMAVLHANDADAGSAPAMWRATAVESIDYVWRRARDTKTGMFFQSLVTSGDPGHDALGAGAPADDALLTDVQGSIVLGLARAQDLFSTLQSSADAGVEAGVVPVNTYWHEADAVVTGMVGASLWNGMIAPDGGIVSNPAPGAFFEGILHPDGGTMTNMTTLGNSLLLGGFHRVAAGIGSSARYVPVQIRDALTQRLPTSSSLFSVVGDLAGQMAYVRAASSSWGLAVSFGADGGAGGPEPGATEYRADATFAVLEGLTQIWQGRMNPPQCGN